MNKANLNPAAQNASELFNISMERAMELETKAHEVTKEGLADKSIEDTTHLMCKVVELAETDDEQNFLIFIGAHIDSDLKNPLTGMMSMMGKDDDEN